MKKLLLITLISVITACVGYAQQIINLPHSRTIGYDYTAKKWESWPAYTTAKGGSYDYITTLKVRKIEDDIFEIFFDYGGTNSGLKPVKVVYDPTETKRLNTDNKTTGYKAYRYAGMDKDYIRTFNISLDDIAANANNWRNKSNAYIYDVLMSQASITQYASQLPLTHKKYNITFKSTSTRVKGTQKNWTNWSQAPKNSYFELAMIENNAKYNLKYYEGGTKKFDVNIVYDKELSNNNKSYAKEIKCYKVEGQTDQFIYLLNMPLSELLQNPKKWDTEENAVIEIRNNKTGNYSRIK